MLLKFEIVTIFNSIQEEKKRQNWFKNVTSEGDRYYNSVVDNLQKNKDNIVLKKNVIVRGLLKIVSYGGSIFIDENTYIGYNSQIWSAEKITIGKNVLISDNVFISDTNSHEMDYLERAESYHKMITLGHPSEKGNIETAAINISDYAWISYGAIILKGVSVGKGAIVAAGAVVTKHVPDFTLVAGNPAKVIKKL